MTPRQKMNVDLVATAIGHFAVGNHAANLDLLTEDCVYDVGSGATAGTVPYHGRHVGKAAVGTYLKTLQQHTIRANCGGNEDDAGEAPTPATPTAPATPAPAVANATPALSSDNRHAADASGKTYVPYRNKVIVLGRIKDRFRKDGSDMHESDFVQVWTVDEAQGRIKGMQMFTDTGSIAAAWAAKGTPSG
jgi:ketosteroid isomerase-like protein